MPHSHRFGKGGGQSWMPDSKMSRKEAEREMLCEWEETGADEWGPADNEEDPLPLPCQPQGYSIAAAQVVDLVDLVKVGHGKRGKKGKKQQRRGHNGGAPQIQRSPSGLGKSLRPVEDAPLELEAVFPMAEEYLTPSSVDEEAGEEAKDDHRQPSRVSGRPLFLRNLLLGSHRLPGLQRQGSAPLPPPVPPVLMPRQCSAPDVLASESTTGVPQSAPFSPGIWKPLVEAAETRWSRLPLSPSTVLAASVQCDERRCGCILLLGSCATGAGHSLPLGPAYPRLLLTAVPHVGLSMDEAELLVSALTGMVAEEELSLAALPCQAEYLLEHGAAGASGGHVSAGHWPEPKERAAGLAMTGETSRRNSCFTELRLAQQTVLGAATEALDEWDLERRASGTSGERTRLGRQLSASFGEQQCCICMDQADTPFEGAALSVCGHWCCRDCWQGYLDSCAKSGTAEVTCPAFRCTTALSPASLACLAGNHHSFSQLARFRREAAAGATGSSEARVRFCPSPQCGQLLLATTCQAQGVFLCPCGTALCGACGGEAHFGIPCEKFTSYQKSVAALDQALESLAWISDNTKPCPRCENRIQKNGGCLHMRCQQCNYYFCWECGGDGHHCSSFQCRSAGSKAPGYRGDAAEEAERTLDRAFGDIGAQAEAHGMIRRLQAIRASARRKASSPSSTGHAAAAHLLPLLVDLSLLHEWLWLRKWAGRVEELEDALETLAVLVHSCQELVRQAERAGGAVIRRAPTPRKLQQLEKLNETRPSRLSTQVGSLPSERLELDAKLLVKLPLAEFKQTCRQGLAMGLRVLARAAKSGDSPSAKSKKRGTSHASEDLLSRRQFFDGFMLPGGKCRTASAGEGPPPWQRRDRKQKAANAGACSTGTKNTSTQRQRGAAWKGKEKAKSLKSLRRRGGGWE
mmetsp:Transcript_12981/g.37771  ORF Transcript_12981/g.37771 Transcript_12981/m.37771 type:complete len:917 (-) Transcript_12981:149-2899(-)